MNKHTYLPLFFIALLTLSGCGSVEDIDQTQAETSDNTSTVMMMDDSIEDVTIDLPLGTPLEEIVIHENERNTHSMYYGTTLAASYASAGDVVRLDKETGPFPEDTLLLYFNDTTMDESEGKKSFGMVYSLDDGKTWSDRITVPIESPGENFIAADASILQHEDGSLLLYFYALDPRGDHNKERGFYLATSLDGLTFTVETEIYRTQEPYNSPEVVHHNNAWYLILGIPEEYITAVAVGETPYAFGELNEFDFPGIAGAASDGSALFLYDCSSPIKEYIFQDGSLTYTRDTEFYGCVPSPYFNESSELKMVSQR